tara:strand:+ start:7582 stop:7884 length:303 start_codon:yes stop_codon:yes gene_type:complete
MVKPSILGNILYLSSIELLNNNKKGIVPLKQKLDPSKVTPAYSKSTKVQEIKNFKNCDCDKTIVFLSSLEDIVVYCNEKNDKNIKTNSPNYDLYHKYFEF